MPLTTLCSARHIPGKLPLKFTVFSVFPCGSFRRDLRENPISAVAVAFRG